MAPAEEGAVRSARCAQCVIKMRVRKSRILSFISLLHFRYSSFIISSLFSFTSFGFHIFIAIFFPSFFPSSFHFSSFHLPSFEIIFIHYYRLLSFLQPLRHLHFRRFFIIFIEQRQGVKEVREACIRRRRYVVRRGAQRVILAFPHFSSSLSFVFIMPLFRLLITHFPFRHLLPSLHTPLRVISSSFSSSFSSLLFAIIIFIIVEG